MIELLPTMTRGMFGGVKVTYSTPPTLYLQLSTVVVALCFEPVLLPVDLVHCTKDGIMNNI